MKIKDLTPEQIVNTRYYCQWVHGAKEYFDTMDAALAKAAEMYNKKDSMSQENFEFWLKQSQVVGVQTVITTPIANIQSPTYVGS